MTEFAIFKVLIAKAFKNLYLNLFFKSPPFIYHHYTESIKEIKLPKAFLINILMYMHIKCNMPIILS